MKRAALLATELRPIGILVRLALRPDGEALIAPESPGGDSPRLSPAEAPA